jgi:hypothetical protein
MLVEVAIEFFTTSRKTYLFNLYTKANQNKVLNFLSNLNNNWNKKSITVIVKRKEAFKKLNYTEQWLNGIT